MTTPNTSRKLKRVVASSVTAALLMQAVSPVFAAVMQVPGIYFLPPDPNVMFTLDDSGSMTSDAIPDMLNDPSTSVNDVAGMPTNQQSNALDQSNATFPGMWKSGSTYLSTAWYRSTNAAARYLRSSAGNPLYYDPKVTYRPWPDPNNDQQPYPYGINGNADPAAVNIHTSDPFNTGRRINLTARVNESGGTGAGEDETRNYWPATYYVYTGTTPLAPAKPNTGAIGDFVKYTIKTAALTPNFPRAETRTDCSGAVGTTGCSRDEELQNFANWLQYYRNRMLMAKGGVAAAFAQQGANLRVGFHTINSGATMRQPVRPFSGTNRTAFYNDLYSRPTNGSTPLRQAMDYVGRYFLGSTSLGNPWTETATARPTLTDRCRKSYHILSTDGFWNGPAATGAAASNNNDEFAGASTPPLPSNSTYPYTDTAAEGTMAARFSVSPFRDNIAQLAEGTLAAVAAYYWRTDLQGPSLGAANLGNYVTPSSRDPAHWQHLTTFTVGLGVSGTGQVRPRDTSLSVVNSNNQYVVSPTVASRPDYAWLAPYINKPWLSEDGLRNLLISKRVDLQWTAAVADTPTTGDDLIHAAMNGRGRYFSATNPTDLATGISSALAEATNQDRSFASLGLANTNETSTSNRLYQAIYNPFGWRGRLYSFSVSNGTFSTAASSYLWEASQAMPAPTDRNIFTWNGEGTPQGSLFTWAGLNATQRQALGNSLIERTEVLEWLRGSAAREAAQGGTLRDRPRDSPTAGVLGDIVGGSPLRGPTAGGGYGRLSTANAATATARSTYPAFRSADASAANSPIAAMTKTLFFGANDGMLHALNAVDDPADYAYNANTMGRERFAYVPNSVFSVPRTLYSGSTSTVRKLYELSQPDYNHLFTVNAPPQIADAYIRPTVGNETGWKSVLVGATGAGSRGVYALDVTNPEVGVAANQFNASKVLWEFSEAQSADMGHVVAWPNVALMRDGTWVAIFGNGYDSSTGRAKLFIVNLDTGAVVWEQAVGTAGGNGLSQPNFLLNNNREVIAIWAGDLQGNMWKFDVSSALRSEWRVAFNGSPLFTTPANQPITVMPEIEQFPGTENAMLVFGTGKFVETQDVDTRARDANGVVVNKNLAARQAIYGIWDNGTSTVTGVSQLVEQTIGTGVNGFLRTSENPVDYGTRRGWYIQLSEDNSRPGERVNVNPIIPVKGRNVPVFVIANTPSLTPCEGSGAARVFALDPITGQTPRFSVFDADRLNGINSADARSNVMLVATGLLSSPRFLSPIYSGGIVQEAPGSRGRTGGLEGGVEFGNNGSGNAGCSAASNGRLIAGVSDTTTVNERIRLGECTPRISWRQIK